MLSLLLCSCSCVAVVVVVVVVVVLLFLCSCCSCCCVVVVVEPIQPVSKLCKVRKADDIFWFAASLWYRLSRSTITLRPLRWT